MAQTPFCLWTQAPVLQVKLLQAWRSDLKFKPEDFRFPTSNESMSIADGDTATEVAGSLGAEAQVFVFF